jgi:hypothetical protein
MESPAIDSCLLPELEDKHMKDVAHWAMYGNPQVLARLILKFTDDEEL